jgi:steroid delta-isomerase-like uncharacterized protein
MEFELANHGRKPELDGIETNAGTVLNLSSNQFTVPVKTCRRCTVVRYTGAIPITVGFLMSEHNQQIVRAYVDAFNRGDIDALCKLFAPDALVYGVLGWGELDKVVPIWRDLIDCWRMQLQIESIAAQGNTVAVRYTERGQSVKPFRGKPVTGGTYEVVAMEWFEFKDGLIHRRWGARDSASIFRQMGMPLE